MKRLFITICCLLPLGLMAQKPFHVKGKVGAVNAPAKAYLSYRIGSTMVTDSVDMNKGTFEFKGEVPGPLAAGIRIKHDNLPLDPDPKKRPPVDGLNLYLDAGEILVNAKDSVKNAKVTGAKVNLDHERYKTLFKDIDAEVAVLMKEYNAYTPDQRKDEVFMKPFMDRYNKANEPREALNKKFAAENRDSYLGLVAFRSFIGYDFEPAEVESEFNKFTPALRETADGKQITSLIEGNKKRSIGTVIDFTQNDPDGKPVKLSDFRGKYVLVDFWASWCGPCRDENPNIVNAYNKFKDRNFTIIGVSLDQPGKKDAWLKAIADDKLTWTHVSDLKFWNNEVSQSFGIQAIPFSILVDPTGKIIAKNLRGEELHTKLEEFLSKGAK